MLEKSFRSLPQQRIYSHTTGVMITQTTLRNVTTLKLNGPVVIDSGKTSVISPNGTTIKNSFEVRQGAEFVIKPILP